LKIIDLKTHFFTDEGTVKAVGRGKPDYRGGESVGLVGESGSGKSMTAFSILRLCRTAGEDRLRPDPSQGARPLAAHREGYAKRPRQKDFQ